MWNNFGEVDVFLANTLGRLFFIKLNLVIGCVCLCFFLFAALLNKQCLSKLGSNLPVSGWCVVGGCFFVGGVTAHSDVCRLPSQSSPLTLSPGHPWVEVRSFCNHGWRIIQMTYSSQNTTKTTRILLPYPSFNVPWKRDHFQRKLLITYLPTIIFEGQAVVFWGE